MKLRRVSLATVALLFLTSLAFGQDGRRTEHLSAPYTETGVYICSCSGFDVLVDWVYVWHTTLQFDANGALIRGVEHVRDLGEAVFYNSSNPELFLVGGPGQGQNNRLEFRDGYFYISGNPIKIRVPGYGPIFFETGHWVVDSTTFEIIFDSGHNQYSEGDVGALCRFLTPIP